MGAPKILDCSDFQLATVRSVRDFLYDTFSKNNNIGMKRSPFFGMADHLSYQVDLYEYRFCLS